MEISKFWSVSTLVFPRVEGPLPFDVYLRLSPERYAKVFSKGSPIETERLEGYVLKGIKHFHIPREDRKAYLILTGSLLESPQQDFNDEATQHILDQTAENVLHEIFSQNAISPDSMKMTQSVVRSYVRIAKTEPAILPHIIKLARSKKEMYRHCIMTSIFSTLLTRALLPDDETAWMNAGLAGFLHDVGMCNISGPFSEHDNSLPSDIKKQVLSHPRFSTEIVEGVGLPSIVVNAIRNHHEYWDGSGYPLGLKGEDIPTLSRILTLTELFATYVASGAELGRALSPHLAVYALRKTSKVDPYMLETFIKLLKIE